MPYFARSFLVFTLVFAPVLVFPTTAPSNALFLRGDNAFSTTPPVRFTRWYRGHFATFKRHYLTDHGRIIDPENGYISHSEGQAYGMLIALLADERATFERIWGYTRRNFARGDGLYGWRYETGYGITDWNNATDADILIAFALGAAGERWRNPDYLAAAALTADAVGDNLIRRHRGKAILMPGNEGFGRRDHADGPVVNLSYYHYFALSHLAQYAPQHPWQEVMETGLDLTYRSVRRATLSDWTSVENPERPRPAAYVAPEFGYNAVRVGFNLVGVADDPIGAATLTLLHRQHEGGIVRHRVDGDGGAITPMDDPGYAVIAQYARCLVDGIPIDAALFEFEPTTYYASALHLIVLGSVWHENGHCVPRQ